MAKLVSRLPEIAAGTDAALSRALHDTAEHILMLIRLYAPVNTGALRDSYDIQEDGFLHILIGSLLLYAKFMEYGFVHKGGKQVAARPHVTPAFLQSEEYFKEAAARRMRELVGG
jgi:hypothetical protein